MNYQSYLIYCLGYELYWTRPLLPKYIPLYSVEQAKGRSDAGLTGWAQVNGRNNTSWERRLSLILGMLKITFFINCKILAITIFKVIAEEILHQKIIL